MTISEDDDRRRKEASGWSWHSVERGESRENAERPGLTHHIGNRLRLLYTPPADAPDEWRRLIDVLAAKGL